MTVFKGKTAIISGGAEGIGLSIAKALAREGMQLVLADINEESLVKASTEVQALGASVLTAKLDVAQPDQWHAVAEQAIDRFGSVHMLVNNAGVGGESGPLEQQGVDGWRWAVDVNLMGVVYGGMAIVPLIKAHGEGGWIINVASMAGHLGLPMGGAYTATKFAVVGLSESWAVEFAEADIHVSVLCPGFVKTRIHESQRNRPQRYTSENMQKSTTESTELAIKQYVESGMPAELVGRRVVEAIAAKELYIFTHSEGFREAVKKRFAAIDASFAGVSSSQCLSENL